MSNPLITARDAFAAQFPERRIALNGRDWGYLEAGQGPALLLIPGTLGRGDIFWQQIAALSDRLDAAGDHRLDRLRQDLDARARLLSSLSYKATLERGYAVVRDDKQVVTSADEAGRLPLLTIEFRDGEITAVPTEAPDAPAAPRKASKPKPPPEQGSLF